MTTAKSDQKAVKSKRLIGSDFMQQRLRSWRPVLTPEIIILSLFVIGIFLIPMGIILLYFSKFVVMHVEDYTYCKPMHASTNLTCDDIIMNNPNTLEPCTCTIEFSLNENFNGQVYIYYQLTNFYQNHRRYVESRNDCQLLGHFSSDYCAYLKFIEIDESCSLFNVDESTGKRIIPCGAIANSLFNDTITLFSKSHGEVPLYHTGIAWPSDKERKFKNPSNLKDALKNKVKPIAWRKNLWELDPDNADNNGLQNEDFIVWMRTAAFSKFKKLWRRVNHDSQAVFKDGLPSGLYEMRIGYNYPVTKFQGTKSFILLTTSIFGGKNTFLGWTSIIVGTIYFLLGIALVILHRKYRSLALHSAYITTPRTGYT